MEGIHNNRVKLSAESTAALRGSERGDVYEHMLDAPVDESVHGLEGEKRRPARVPVAPVFLRIIVWVCSLFCATMFAIEN